MSSGVVGNDDEEDDQAANATGKRSAVSGGTRAAASAQGSSPASRLQRASSARSLNPGPSAARRGSVVGADGAAGGPDGASDEAPCQLFARIRGHSQGIHSLVYIEVRNAGYDLSSMRMGLGVV